MHRLSRLGLSVLGVVLAASTGYAANVKVSPALANAAASAAAQDALPEPTVVQYVSNGLTLKAWIYKPDGPGPFPAILSNHGSEQDPRRDKSTGAFWVSQGFVFFKPVRSGHGGNPGAYISDETDPIKAQVKSVRANRKTTAAQLQNLYDQVMALHQKANEDVVAAYRWLTEQPYIDKSRIVVMGGSYGGIQTLLTAEANKKDHLGIRGFIPMSPAAESWEFGKPRPQDPGGKNPEANTAFARYLTDVIKDSEGPIFLMQAHNDYNLGPTTYLGPVVSARGAPNRCAVFPIHGAVTDPKQGHGGFFGDPSAWSAEVWEYLQAIGEVPAEKALVLSAVTITSPSKADVASARRGSGLTIETCGPGE
jgi:carboxymethylenebutenolidase